MCLPLCQRGIGLGKHCCQERPAWQEPVRAICCSALPEYPRLSNQFLSQVAAPADIARHSRLLPAECFLRRRTLQ